MSRGGTCPVRMSRRPGARAVALVAVALLAMSALVPIALADHAYSHRYIVFGRVIDAENNPVPGLTIDLGYEPPFTPEGACSNQPGTETTAFGPTQTRPVTNQLGEFTFCFHTHGLSRFTAGSAIVRVESMNVEKKIEFDGFMRYTFTTLKLPEPHPNANKTALSQEYTVFSRMWRASDAEIKVEGIGVYGDTVHNKPAQVVVAIDGKEPQTFDVTTNSYGDLAIRVPVTERPTGGKVTLTIDNETFEEPIDPATGVTHIRGQIGEEKKTPGAAPVLVALVLVGLALVSRRRS